MQERTLTRLPHVRFPARSRARSWRLLGVAVVSLVGSSFVGCGDAPAPSSSPRDSWQAELEALGYINSVPADGPAEIVGVTVDDRSRSYPGLNLFNSRNEPIAKLMTTDGRIVHRWQSDVKGETARRFRQLLPEQRSDYFDGWNHLELLDDGDLLAIGSHHMLLRLDWDSNVLWKRDIAAHHDLAVASNGEIHVLTDGIRNVEIAGRSVAFQDNYVVTLGPDGEFRGRWSLYEAYRGDAGVARRLEELGAVQHEVLSTVDVDTLAHHERLYLEAMSGDFSRHADVKNLLFHGKMEDVFHANSIQLLREHPEPWRQGDFLLTIKKLNSIAVIDGETQKVKWTWGKSELQKPHHATQLADGSILVFDNGVDRGFSRVLKLDPRSGEIIWSYLADPPEDFFSKARGGAQELPNGNILIAETDKGRAFEVTPEGEIVWEFYNDVWRDRGGKPKRGAIYRMTRVDPDVLPPHARVSEDL
jgi:hypothetical protein